MKEVDVRTLACPGPVIRLKELLATGANFLRFHVADELARALKRVPPEPTTHVAALPTAPGAADEDIIVFPHIRPRQKPKTLPRQEG